MSCISPEQVMLLKGVGVAKCKGSDKGQDRRTEFMGKVDA